MANFAASATRFYLDKRLGLIGATVGAAVECGLNAVNDYPIQIRASTPAQMLRIRDIANRESQEPLYIRERWITYNLQYGHRKHNLVVGRSDVKRNKVDWLTRLGHFTLVSGAVAISFLIGRQKDIPK